MYLSVRFVDIKDKSLIENEEKFQIFKIFLKQAFSRSHQFIVFVIYLARKEPRISNSFWFAFELRKSKSPIFTIKNNGI
jgi:hypothetical protein